MATTAPTTDVAAALAVKERVVEAERLTKLVPDKVHTWPYLVRLEMLVGTIIMAFMTVWAIVVDAPLEEPANPTKTPNPSKAPWYFLGLQEILVYFDPKGNGYYCFKDRWFSISTFLFGFLVMWIVLIIMGTFIRGPGWYLFLPGQYWDVHKSVAITNRDLPAIFGLTSFYPAMAFGATCVGIWIVGIPAVFWQLRHKKSD